MSQIITREHLKNYTSESYVTEEEDIFGDMNTLDCSYGSNPFGCSKKLILSPPLFNQDSIYNYSHSNYSLLKQQLADNWKEIADIKPNNIRICCGSIGGIEKINKLFIDVGSRVLGYSPQFTDYIKDLGSMGGIYESVSLKKEQKFKFDMQDFINRMESGYRLIYIDNPNNPTGQFIPLSSIEQIVKKANQLNICIIIDEAYGDFIENTESAISLVNKYNNLIVTRTLSKGYGLAGLRIGYTIAGDEITENYCKIDSPFLISSYSEIQAVQALKDRDFIINCIEKIKESKSKIIKACSKINVLETSLSTPIMVLSCEDAAIDLKAEFEKYGILTVSGKSFNGLGSNYIRLRVPSEGIDRLVTAINDLENHF